MHQKPGIIARLGLMLLLALASAAAPAAEDAAGKVNINTASLEQLRLLPRIGPVVAERIVEFRDQNGGFKSTEELLLVSGIGERTFELLEPYVAIEGETTLEEKVSSSSSGGG